MDFGSILRKSCVMYRDNVAVTCGEDEQTYRQLWERACRVANALRDLGLAPGDRVAMLADNEIATIEQIAGIALAGMVRTPMYVQNTPEVNAYLLDLVGAKACIVHERYAAGLNEIKDSIPSLEHLVVLGGEDNQYEKLLAAASTEDPAVDVGQDDPHIIRFSAGTTGRPKGIVHSVRGWLAMGNEFALVLPRMEEEDAYLVAAPLTHAAGLFIWPLIAHGARHVVMPAFDPAGFLDLVESRRCTLTLLVPTMIQMVAGVPDARRRDLSSLRAVFYGAAPITDRTLKNGLALWGNIMYQLYGQSESLPATVLTPRHHIVEGEGRRLLRSAGRPTPNTVVTSRADDGALLPAGEVGEICVRSPGGMAGVWGDAEATALRFTPDGAVRTRDMGYLDQDGFVFLTDRAEDLIISGGFNVYPAEVENALASHPAVNEAAVVGVPHEKWGEAVMAVVVLHDGQQAGEQELIDWVKERIGSVKKPSRVDISTDPLPKSEVGKILRRVLRERFVSNAEYIHGA